MIDPVPTPFDIAPIPASPLAPSLISWALLLGSVLVSGIILALVYRNRKSRLPSARSRLLLVLQVCLHQLNQNNLRETAGEAVRAVRRYAEISKATNSVSNDITQDKSFLILDNLRFSANPDIGIIKRAIADLAEIFKLEGQQ